MQTNLTEVGKNLCMLWGTERPAGGFSQAVSLITANTLQLQVGHSMESSGCSNSEEVN